MTAIQSPTGDSQPPAAPEERERTASQRTCVGCGQGDSPDEMVRLVISPEGEVAVDLAGGTFGRGAHLHPVLRCLAGAGRGLARSFRRPIRITADELGAAIAAAADRRVHGLLASAARAQRVEIGAERAGHGFDSGKVDLIVVARDAAAGATTGPVLRAIAAGLAVSWGTKVELGALVGKSEVAVLGIVSERIAVALRDVVRMASSVAPSGAKAHENGLKGERAAED